MPGGYGRHLVLALALGGSGIVAFVVGTLPVTPVTQAVFYAAGFAGLSGIWALLREFYYGRRPPPGVSRGPSAISLLGSGMRFAFTVEFALWLQSLRMLTPAYVGVLLVSYLLLEYLFRAADRRVS